MASTFSIIAFNLEAPLGSILTAGFLDGPGTIAPSATSVSAIGGMDNVAWDFVAPSLSPGATSEDLFVTSSFAPGTVNDNMVALNGEFAFDTQGECVGPQTELAGPCCFPDGSCEEFPESECDTFGGIFKNDGTQCGPTGACEEPGACCTPDGSCIDSSHKSDCDGLGGVFHVESECFAIVCEEPALTGACCLPDGSCVSAENEDDCDSQGGEY